MGEIVRHHNNKGRRQIQNGKTVIQVEHMARRLRRDKKKLIDNNKQ